MNRLLPFQSSSRPEPGDGSRIVAIDDDAAGQVFEALSSDMTRDVLAAIYDTPGTASEIADATDTSIQNVKYHLTKLQDANLIEVADTWYSEQGNEMKVYAPTNESVVMLAGDETTRTSIRETLSRLIGVLGMIGIISILIDTITFAPSSYHWQSTQPTAFPSWIPFLDSGFYISPGGIFFISGLISIFMIVCWSFYSQNHS